MPRVLHRTLICVRSRWTGCVRSKKYALGSLLETTGGWGFSVRSVLSERPVNYVAVEIGRSVFEANDSWRSSHDRTLRSSVRSLHSSASGHHLTVGIGCSVFEERGHVACIARLDAKVYRPINLTGASGRPMFSPVKGYNNSISLGLYL